MKKLASIIVLMASLAPSVACGTAYFAPPGTITVKVVDVKMTPLPGVIVKLTAEKTQEPFKPLLRATPASGRTSFENLPEGAYRLDFSLPGFFQTTIRHVPVVLDEHRNPRLQNPIVVVLTSGPVFEDEVH